MKNKAIITCLALLIICSSVFPQNLFSSQEKKRRERITNIGTLLAGKSVTLTRYFKTSTIRTEDRKQIEVSAMVVYNTASHISIPPGEGIRISFGSQLAYLDYREVPSFIGTLKYFKECRGLWAAASENCQVLRYRTTDDLLAGSYESSKKGYIFFEFGKYVHPLRATIKETDLDLLIKGVSDALSILEKGDYGKAPPKFQQSTFSRSLGDEIRGSRRRSGTTRGSRH